MTGARERGASYQQQRHGAGVRDAFSPYHPLGCCAWEGKRDGISRAL